MIDVSCKIDIIELDGKESIPPEERPDLIISSHWNYDNRVVIQIGDKRLTVIGRDLIVAVENSMRTRRHGA